jgi:tetratricopeptide (TPR) repeat protein
LINLYTEELGIYVTCPVMRAQLAELFNDLYEPYRNTLKRFSTFMSKPATVRYLLTTFVVRSCVVSWQVQALATSAANNQQPRPTQQFWFLPHEEEGELVSPLHNALQWAYQVCGVSQAQFHRPAGVADLCGQLARNLDTCRRWKWLSKAKPPTLPALYRNLVQSFEALERAGNPVPLELRRAIITTVSVSRIASYVAHSIESIYGRAFLLETCQQLKLYTDWLSPHIKIAQAKADRLAEHTPIPDLSLEKTRSHYALREMTIYLRQCDEAYAFIQSNRGSDGSYNPLCIDWVEKQLGTFAARINQDITSRWVLDKPDGFDELMAEANAMRRRGRATLSAIDELEVRMSKTGVAERVPWVLHWLRAVVHYNADQFDKAAEHYTAAFQLGRYSAGDHQYLLMNQYLEAMAKTKRWLQFKQGAFWADYLGLKVRHLRDRDLTEENIRFAFTMLGMRNAKYFQM